MASLEQYCNERLIWLKKNWQMLPVHTCLLDSEPIPLPAIVKRYEGKKHIEADDQKFLTPQEAVEFAIKKQRVTFILGEPGAGKTAATKWIAKFFNEQCLQTDGSEGYLPVWVDLASYPDQETLDEILSHERRSIPDVSGNMNILWVLDGFDVLLGYGHIVASRFVRDANDLSEESFIISSRPSSLVEDAIDAISAELRIELQRLTPELSKQWMAKYCKDAIPAYDRFVGDNPVARGLVNVPLFFSMVVSAAIDQNEENPPLRIDEYSGRAGMFRGFVQYAMRLKHLDCDSKYHPDVVAKVFYGAIMVGCDDRFPADKAKALLTQYESEHQYDEWNTSVEILRKAGLIVRDGDIRVIHQQFAEYWAACHLAAKLKQAEAGGYLAAELWDHCEERRLDTIIGQAISISSREVDPQCFFSCLGDEELKIELLTQIGSPGNIEFLVQSLKNKDKNICQKAFTAIVQCGSSLFAAALAKMITAKTISVESRGLAVLLIGRLCCDDCIGILIKLFQDDSEDESLRIKAVVVLGELHSTNVIDIFGTYLENCVGNEGICRAIVTALGKIGGDKSRELLYEALIHAKPADIEAGAMPIVPPLCSVIDAKLEKRLQSLILQPNIRGVVLESVIAVLDKAGSIESAVYLETRMLREDTDEYCRGFIAASLGRIGAVSSVGPLMRLYEVKYKPRFVHVRREVPLALAKIGSTDAVEFLIIKLKSAELCFDARHDIAEALRANLSEQIRLDLMQILQDGQESNETRILAADVLRECGSKFSMEYIASVLSDDQLATPFRILAIRLLGVIGVVGFIPALRKIAVCDCNNVGIRLVAVESLMLRDAENSFLLLDDALEYTSFLERVKKSFDDAISTVNLPEMAREFVDDARNALSCHDFLVAISKILIRCPVQIPVEVQMILCHWDHDHEHHWTSWCIDVKSYFSNTPYYRLAGFVYAVTSHELLRERFMDMLGHKISHAASRYIQCISDQNERTRIRLNAIFRVGIMATSDALDSLHAVVQDVNADSFFLRSDAAEALGKIASETSLEVLWSVFADERNDAILRKSLMDSLCDIGASNEDALLAFIDSHDIEYEFKARLLKQLGRRVCPPSMRDTVEQQRDKRQEYLQSQGVCIVNNINDFRGSEIVNSNLSVGTTQENITQSLASVPVVDKAELTEATATSPSGHGRLVMLYTLSLCLTIICFVVAAKLIESLITLCVIVIGSFLCFEAMLTYGAAACHIINSDQYVTITGRLIKALKLLPEVIKPGRGENNDKPGD